MSTIILRTLARKSIINFGKYEGYSVQQMIDLHHTGYLRWMYYNSSNITFQEDILRQINVTEEREIVKPGVDRKKYNEVSDLIQHGLVKHKIKLKSNKRSRGRLATIINSFPSRHELMMKNHGHKR